MPVVEEKRVALVTGGGSGIGRATCHRFACEGMAVIVTDISAEAADKVAGEIEAQGGSALSYHLDVAQEAAWASVVAAVEDRFGRLDALINNAGISQIKPLGALTLDDWNRDIAVNLTGPFLGVRACLDLLTRTASMTKRDSIIVNVCSMAAINGTWGMPGYAASKGGLRLFTKSIAGGLMKNNRIRVNSIYPGMTDTNLMTQMVDTQVAMGQQGSVEQARQAWAGGAPIGRLAEPEDMANVIAFLTGEDSAYLVGEEIVINGGKGLA